MLEQTAGNGDGIPPSLRRGFVPSSRIVGLSSMFSCVSRLKEALGVWRHSIFVVHHETCRSCARLGDWACVHASSRILSERSIDIVGKPTDIYALLYIV